MFAKKIKLLIATLSTFICVMVMSFAMAEVELTAVTGLPKFIPVSQVFLKFVERVNARGKGIVQIKYIGGPEITPTLKQAAALERGLFDILHTPGAFFAGKVKEVDVMLASNLPITEMRKNGGMDLIVKIWRERMDVHVLGWFDTSVAFHMYAGKKKPEVTASGVSFKGFKMFSTPTFREFEEALGATPVPMNTTEIVTAMDRGLIQGFGFPDYSLSGLGLHRVAKWRIDPTYYRGNVMAMVNGKKWDSLSKEVRDFLQKEAIEWEVEAAEFILEMKNKDLANLKKNGMQIITLGAAAGKSYRKLAHDIAWKRLEKRSTKYAAQLKALTYDPNR